MAELDLTRYFNRMFKPLTPEQLEGLARPAYDSRYAIDPEDASSILKPGYLLLENGIARLEDGTVMVAVRNEMPGVSADMMDWWFGFTEYEDERYQVWHPLDHLAAHRDKDHRDAPTDKERYVGNTSRVEEYVGGGKVYRFAISFRDPELVKLAAARVNEIGTAIYATVADSDTGVPVSSFLHMVREKPGGSELRSRFWQLNPDETSARKLICHCAEEFGNLASFLPALYREATTH